MQRALALLFALWFVVLLPAGAQAGEPVLLLDEAEIVVTDSAKPPPDSAPWQRQRLPDYWPESRSSKPSPKSAAAS